MSKNKKTRLTQAILREFNAQGYAISVSELICRNAEIMNRSTVYRILERLESEGILHSIIGNDGLKWYAKFADKNHSNSKDHPHFQCTTCGRVECIDVEIKLPSLVSHKVQSANLLLSGKCSKCD